MNRWNGIPYDVLETLCKETAHLPSLGSNDKSRPSTNNCRKSLFALSMVDSRTRGACYPWLFRKMTFDKTWSGSPSWEAFDERMKHMVKNPALCRAVKSFELDAWVRDIGTNCPSPTTYALLPRFLASFPQLHTLTFRIQDPFVPGFRFAFEDVVKIHGPFLAIEKLIISRSCTFLIKYCPNILEFEESWLYRDKTVEFITITESLSASCHRLRALHTKAEISSKTLRDILKSIPLLEELKLSSSLSSRFRIPRHPTESLNQSNGQGIMVTPSSRTLFLYPTD
ncbi:hypothetical protein JAAARDRAFT_324037 [Jaapia argillacea MUCL 33604]|uniref:F-box domain-containing protein n=1 Tax=Jaapia argillacea MUCL 33604 TaxID=933084 RepID=A0A067PZ27_9AGAM|nr:hypothetical protein JAAARDRAFT_324037 [Jaapia argillacea MUCL 33604]